MRFLKFVFFTALFAMPLLAQVPTPQLNLSGNVGTVGFPVLNSGTFPIPTDADYTLTISSVNTSCVSCKITSTVALTATRQVIYPAGKFFLNVENATTGGQSITIIGPSGTGVTIANGTAVSVWNDGTNFVQIGSAVSTNNLSLTGSATLNSSPICTNSTGCPPSTTPAGSETRFIPSATCNGGVAYSSGLSTYDNQQPQLGCINSAASAAAYMAFQAAASNPQYATATFATPPYWTGSDIAVVFGAIATTGNVSWVLESGCSNPNGDLSSITWGTPVTITANASSTSLGLVNTALTTGFAVPGTNSCAAGTTAAGSLVTYRLHRASTDTAAGDAHLLGVVLTSRRSQ